MVLTMSAVAENKDIHVTKLQVRVAPDIQEERGAMRTRFLTYIDIGQGLSRRERIILFNAARRCEVHKLLSGTTEFEFELVE